MSLGMILVARRVLGARLTSPGQGSWETYQRQEEVVKRKLHVENISQIVAIVDAAPFPDNMTACVGFYKPKDSGVVCGLDPFGLMSYDINLRTPKPLLKGCRKIL